MSEARYLYCVAKGSQEIHFDKIGIGKNEVYTVPYRELCAVVHNSTPEPYKSDEEEDVKSWLVAHEKVIETAWKEFGTVLPLGFDTIIRGDHERNAEENIKQWLKDVYKDLMEKLDKVREKAEYGVQIFFDPELVGAGLLKTNQGIKKLNQDINSSSKGLAYMYKQKLESVLRKEIEKEAEKISKEIYLRIKKHVDHLKVEKTKKSDTGKKMLMNLSCLIPREKSELLGEELEKINSMQELSVRFTGPWPPYSFV